MWMKKIEAMSAEITVEREDALVDEVIKITVKGLQKYQKVTVRAEVIENGLVFAGSGCFVADDSGTVDITNQPSTNGTYKGVYPMGLFWSMRSSPGMPEGMRLAKDNASSALVTDLTVFPGHLKFEETFTSNLRRLCNKQIRRWYMAKGVQKRKVRSGRIRGILFLPPEEHIIKAMDANKLNNGRLGLAVFMTGYEICNDTNGGKGPFPGVIDMYGITGSCTEYRAALLASRGFASIALPYVSYDDLPKDGNNLDMEYFIEAVDWFSMHPFVDENNLGAIGLSKGGEFALHLGYYSNRVKSVVSVSGGPCFSIVPVSYKGKYIGTTEYYADRTIATEEGIDFTDTMHCEIWTKDAHVLLICGLDDRCYNTKFLTNLWNCYPIHRKHMCKLYNYAGAGHLIEPPYAPFTRTSKARFIGEVISVLWGGETVAHARAQEDSWKRILNHFRTTLQTSRASEDNLSSSKL